MSEKENSGALLTISDAVHGLVISLEVFQDVATKLEIETEADRSGPNQTSPSFLGGIVGTLKEMVGKWVSEIDAKPEIQKLLLVNQKAISSVANDCVLPQGGTVTKQPSSVVGSLPSEAVCISGTDGRSKKRAALRVVTCRHSCKHHPEVMDPALWSKLPVEVVELVFGKLPIVKIVELCDESKAWLQLSKSSSFRRVAAERHRKLFGLAGWNRSGSIMNVTYDIELKRSCWSDVSGFPIAFDASLANHDFMCSCDGGLVCLVSQEKFLVDPILVGNLLTDEWKALPYMPHLSSGNKKPILVQLVMDEDTKCYKVVLVCRDKYEGALAANCYNSGTGGWSKLDSGLVYGYGGSHDWLSAREEDPCIFDCTTNMLFKLSECSTIRGNGSVKKLSMVKDRVFVLHRWGHDEYKVLEYTWDGTASDLRNLSTIDSTLPTGLPSNYDLHLFSSSGLVLIFGDNCEKGEYHSQLTRLYDSSTKEWHSLAWEESSSFTTADLFSLYMCELRWDAVP